MNERLITSFEAIVSRPLVQRNFEHYEQSHIQRSLGHHRELLGDGCSQSQVGSCSDGMPSSMLRRMLDDEAWR